MKTILGMIWEILCATGRAKYAANLARNGKIAEAQALYRD